MKGSATVSDFFPCRGNGGGSLGVCVSIQSKRRLLPNSVNQNSLKNREPIWKDYLPKRRFQLTDVVTNYRFSFFGWFDDVTTTTTTIIETQLSID